MIRLMFLLTVVAHLINCGCVIRCSRLDGLCSKGITRRAMDIRMLLHSDVPMLQARPAYVSPMCNLMSGLHRLQHNACAPCCPVREGTSKIYQPA